MLAFGVSLLIAFRCSYSCPYITVTIFWVNVREGACSPVYRCAIGCDGAVQNVVVTESHMVQVKLRSCICTLIIVWNVKLTRVQSGLISQTKY